MAARASDDDGLKLLIVEHNRRRQLQRDYYARQHAHLRYTARNDDELVECVWICRGLSPVAEPSGFKNVGLEYSRGQNFIGGASLMFDVLALLRSPGSARAKRIVLQGLGGSGKTTLASEIGHAYNKIGHHVFMFKPTPGRDLDEAMSTLVSKARFDVADAAGVRKWLAENQAWLMIVDGVDEP